MILITGTYLGVVCSWMDANNLGATDVYERIYRLKASQRISLDIAGELLEVAARLKPSGAPGLEMARYTQWQYLGALVHMFAGVNSLEEFLYCYVSYERLFYGESLASLRRTAATVEISWQSRLMPRLLAQLTIGSFCVMVKRLFPSDNVLKGVGFQFYESEHVNLYNVFFDCEMAFETQRTYIRFDSEKLSLQIAPQFKPKAFQLNTTIAGDSCVSAESNSVPIKSGSRGVGAEFLFLMKLDESERLFFERLLQEIMFLLPRQEVSVAKRMQVSVRTLQRHLEKYSAELCDGFRGVTGKVRYALARDYLQDPSLDLASVALLLGYSEQSAFNLAFKRWSGVSPVQWKKACKAKPPRATQPGG